ncbi:MAG: ABC transporter permease [Clostridiales bacterium]|nr:ABC transporter permease [Clostridiales bacterium]
MTDLLPLIGEHLLIVFIATVIAVIIGLVLGVMSYWMRFAAPIIIWFAEALQTIPSLALLALLMIIFGLGNATIIVGLVLYALLPIVRNTNTGLSTVSPAIRDAARGMGMSRLQRLLKVELPLAFPLIFSGIKISIVNSLSIAVMGVLIGAGGLGYPIYRGIQTQNFAAIMRGAIPVMVMAVLFDFVMSSIEKRLVKWAK